MRKHTVLRWISLSFCENLHNLRIVFPLFVVAATSALLSADEPYQAAKDDAAVRTFLAGQYQGKLWQQGPARSRAAQWRRPLRCTIRSRLLLPTPAAQGGVDFGDDAR